MMHLKKNTPENNLLFGVASIANFFNCNKSPHLKCHSRCERTTCTGQCSSPGCDESLIKGEVSQVWVCQTPSPDICPRLAGILEKREIKFPLSSLLPSDSAVISAAAKSCPTLCDPIDGSPPGSIPGILQARTLEWVAISFSNASK